MYARYFRSTPGSSGPPQTEARMNASAVIRQSHRWLAIVFTLTVSANFAVRAFAEPPAWITYSPLPPLFLMLFTGLYMFALPYLTKSRRT
jgi:cellulose synthase/poly-beta-1,6-N-acetylglucosamine synthase-like glycosyltransferase